MTRSIFSFVVMVALSISVNCSGAAFADLDATALLEKSDYIMRGESHKMVASMHVETKRWKRDYKLRIWMQGKDHGFARIDEPAKVKGQSFLRIKARLWNYLPTVERTILIPPSLMLDKFLGSDFSNDDFIKMSHLPTDYEAAIKGEETLNGMSATHLILIPRPDAPVTYEKLEVWLRTEDAMPIKIDFYDEDLTLIRTLHYSEFKDFGSHTAPSLWRMENHKDPNRSTVIRVLEAEFNLEIDDSMFSKDNLEKAF